jgi:hypothetical protein
MNLRRVVATILARMVPCGTPSTERKKETP